MKIGFVLDDTLDSSDGVQQYVLTLGHWLADQGHEVHYLAGATKRRPLQHVHSLAKNVSVRFNRNRMSTPLPARRRSIAKLLDMVQFDVLHVQMPHSPLLAGRVINLAHKRGIPVVGTFHILPAGRLESVGTKLLARLQQQNTARLSKLLAVSQPAKIFAETVYRLPVRVVPNPVSIEHFTPDRPKKSAAAPSIVFLGRLVSRKGCLELLKAVADLWQHGHLGEASVTVCGDGPLRTELEDYARTHGIAPRVRFTGFVSDEEKVAYLQSAMIAVFPSTAGESFGIVLIEAMAAGAEVVLAGNNPGYRWVMDSREPQIVNPRDTTLFAAQLRHFLENPTERNRASRWQQSRVRQFSVDTVGRQLLDEYESVIAKNVRSQHNTR